jgi:TRAP-type C4-dicarboxylate transport system substrate-binding protein
MRAHRRRTVCAQAAAFVLGSLALAAPPASAQGMELRLSTFVPPVHVIAREIITPWMEDVAKDSGGEVNPKLYPSMQLGGSPPGLFRQAVEGVVDMVFTLPGYTSPAFPRTQMVELPGLSPDGRAATELLWKLSDPYLKPEYEGVKIIALWAAEDAGIMTRGKVFRTLDDIKGMRIRSPSAAQARQIAVMGGTPVAMPITEVYPGLDRGTIDGAMVPFSTIVDFRLGEVAKTYTIPGPLFGRSSFLIAMNQKKFDSLSPKAKAAIEKHSGLPLSLKATDVYIKRAEQGLASVRGKAEIVELSKAEQDKIAALLRPIVDDWIKESEAKGIPARKMLGVAKHPAGTP